MISVAKNGETKFFEAVQELKNLAKQNDGNNGGNCGTKTADEPKHFDRVYFGGRKKKWKKTSISSLVITLVNQKRKENMKQPK